MAEIAETSSWKLENNCDSVQRAVQTRRIGPTRRSISGLYSFRGQSSVAFESTLERDLLVRLEFFSHVLDVIPQPARIPFVDFTGRRHTYTPDFLVYYRLEDQMPYRVPSPLLIEVKPREVLRESARQWIPKWKAAYRYATSMGWSFRIYDESRIRDHVLLSIQSLEKYKRMSFASEESEQILETVRAKGSASIQYLLARFFMGIYRDRGRAHILHLIATRRLTCDIGRNIDDFLEVWEPRNARHP